MATIDFKNAVGRVFFDGGLTEDGEAHPEIKNLPEYCGRCRCN